MVMRTARFGSSFLLRGLSSLVGVNMVVVNMVIVDMVVVDMVVVNMAAALITLVGVFGGALFDITLLMCVAILGLALSAVTVLGGLSLAIGANKFA